MIQRQELFVANLLSEEDDRLRTAIADPEHEMILDQEMIEKLQAITEVRDRLVGQQALVSVQEAIKE